MHAVWNYEPLPYFALVYMWQDVAHSVGVYEAQRKLLEEQSLVEVHGELSRATAAVEVAPTVFPGRESSASEAWPVRPPTMPHVAGSGKLLNPMCTAWSFVQAARPEERLAPAPTSCSEWE